MVELLRPDHEGSVGFGTEFGDQCVSLSIRIFVRFSVIIQRSAIRRELTKRVMEESPSIVVLRETDTAGAFETSEGQRALPSWIPTPS